MQESGKSPLARLALFMVCLSIAGSLLAGSHYILIDRPDQKYRPTLLKTIPGHVTRRCPLPDISS